MHTKADISVSDNGKTAVLEINGKRIKATLHNDGVFSIMPAEALAEKYEYDADYSDIQKLTVKLDGVTSATICVTLEPIM